MQSKFPIVFKSGCSQCLRLCCFCCVQIRVFTVDVSFLNTRNPSVGVEFLLKTDIGYTKCSAVIFSFFFLACIYVPIQINQFQAHAVCLPMYGSIHPSTQCCSSKRTYFFWRTLEIGKTEIWGKFVLNHDNFGTDWINILQRTALYFVKTRILNLPTAQPWCENSHSCRPRTEQFPTF